MATIKDVAEKAGVSTSTVSHVINETRYVSPELTEKVKEAMEELDYHSPNAIARGLKTKQTFTLGLIVSDITNLFSPITARGLEDIASENGYDVIVSNTDELLEKEKAQIDSLIEERVDGIVIAPTGKSDEKFSLLRSQGIPFVFVDRYVDSVEADLVASKNKEGGYRATEYLIENGHRRIGIVLGLESITSSRERFEGYRNAMQDYGIGIDEQLVVRGDYRLQGGKQSTKQLMELDSPPTAIFATNAMSNLGALKAIKELGMNCPEDISLIGFDDFNWVEIFDPPLTVMAQKPHKIGYEAGKLLLERLHQENVPEYKSIRLDTELIERKSVAERS